MGDIYVDAFSKYGIDLKYDSDKTPG